jgi:hypothetical protein
VNLKTIVGWLAVALAVWFVIKDPTAAAHVVNNIGKFLATAAHGITTFFTSI